MASSSNASSKNVCLVSLKNKKNKHITPTVIWILQWSADGQQRSLQREALSSRKAGMSAIVVTQWLSTVLHASPWSDVID